MTYFRFTIALMLLSACRPAGESHVAAAGTLTRRYAESQFARWKMRIDAAGQDCGILLVTTNGILLDEALVDAVHDGPGPYAVDGRGMEQFSRERQFRGVVYRDASKRIWWRGGVDYNEPLAPCH
jgi:hypothetical protein